MKFNVVSPQQTQKYTVNWIEINTPSGNLIIQNGHAPIIFTLVANKEIFFQLKTGEEISILLDREAFLHVERNEAVALIS